MRKVFIFLSDKYIITINISKKIKIKSIRYIFNVTPKNNRDVINNLSTI
nr:hypothetical protein [Proteus mirabilis]